MTPIKNGYGDVGSTLGSPGGGLWHHSTLARDLAANFSSGDFCCWFGYFSIPHVVLQHDGPFRSPEGAGGYISVTNGFVWVQQFCRN